MTKKKMVEKLSSDLSLPKTRVEGMLDSLINCIADTLEADGEVSLSRIGKFRVTERSARTGRNPRTGEPISIPAKQSVRFSASKTLKDKLN